MMMRTLCEGLAVAVALTVAAAGAVRGQQMDKMDKAGPKPASGSMAAVDKMDKANKTPAADMMAPMMNDFKPFTPEAFKAAQAAGKTTLVFFHAPWCPVCRAQEPKVKAHLNGDAKQVVAFKVDYDTSAMLREQMQVTKQSTLILYQGTKEVARLSYKSDDASIDELFAHASRAAMPMAVAH